MSVTPNFSWPLIEPTDFVTNLPADLEALADDIDADVWAIKGTADAALPETIINAAGDLIYGTANDTAARLAIGTAGQLLAVNSGATAPEWVTFSSGGMTQIATSTFSAVTSVDFTSIPGTYKDLYFVFNNMSSNVDDLMRLQINNNTNSIYAFAHMGTNGGTSFTALSQAAEQSAYCVFRTSNSGTYKSAGYLRFRDYANTSFEKAFDGGGFDAVQVGGNSQSLTFSGGLIRTTSAITSVKFSNYFSSNISGTITLFGVA